MTPKCCKLTPGIGSVGMYRGVNWHWIIFSKFINSKHTTDIFVLNNFSLPTLIQSKKIVRM